MLISQKKYMTNNVVASSYVEIRNIYSKSAVGPGILEISLYIDII